MKEIMITANEAGQRLDKFLRKYLENMSLSSIYKMIRKKEVTVNDKKSSEKYVLSQGDILKFYIDLEGGKTEKKLDFIGVEYDFETVYEDENILIIVKKAGILVHPDEGSGVTLTEQVLSYLYDRGKYKPGEEKTFAPSPCNRLDRNTEGLVIFAKNYDALKLINEMIREGNIEKYYSTIVKGRISDGVYTAYIQKNPQNNRVVVYKQKKDGTKEIKTRVINVESIGLFSHIDIELLTGRSHQIRAHLSYLGNPIVGDPKYGDKETNSFFVNKYNLSRQLLFSYKLVFRNCPPKLSYLEGKTVTMGLPQVFKKIKNDLFKV